MPVPSSFSDLDTTAANNSPPGTESAKGNIDNYLRAHASLIKQNNNAVTTAQAAAVAAQAAAVAAQATADAALPKAGGTMTGALNAAAAVTIPAATTTDIGAAASNSAIISGTTTITGLGTVAAGAVRDVTFSGALTLTHNATSLILPGAANIATAAGDTASFVSLGSGNWRCLSYQKASGAAVMALGVGQTWQSVTRLDATTYTNSTGKPIMLACTLSSNGSAAASVTVTIGAVTLNVASCGNASSGVVLGSGSVIIPPGASYTMGYNNVNSTSFFELR